MDPSTARCEAGFSPLGGGTGSRLVRLDVPSRLIVSDVNGLPVVVQIWASTTRDLEAWESTAMRFLYGVHFSGAAYP